METLIYKAVEKTDIYFMFISVLVLIWIVYFAFIFIIKKQGKIKKYNSF